MTAPLPLGEAAGRSGGGDRVRPGCPRLPTVTAVTEPGLGRRPVSALPGEQAKRSWFETPLHNGGGKALCVWATLKPEALHPTSIVHPPGAAAKRTPGVSERALIPPSAF